MLCQPTDQTDKQVRDVTTHYYTENFSNQPTDLRQDQKTTTSTTNQSRIQEEHPSDAPQLQANVPLQTTDDNHTTHTTKHNKKSPTRKKDDSIPQCYTSTKEERQNAVRSNPI